MNNLTIFREPKNVSRLRRYKLVIDRETVKYIKNGEKLNLYMPFGGHSIYTRIDWLKSKVISFNISEGGQTNLIVSVKKYNYLVKVLSLIPFSLGLFLGGVVGEGFGNKYIGIAIGGMLGGYVYSYFQFRPTIAENEDNGASS